jgi:anti-sigma B factor antagonist
VEIVQQKSNDIVTIKLIGKLDSNTSAQLEEAVLALIDSGEKKLLVDGSQLDYISSAGLRVLLMAAKKLKATGGKIVLACLKDYIIEVFEIAGFNMIFQIFADIAEAQASF